MAENDGAASSASLSNEVQISWNGPEEYDTVTSMLLEDALLEDYFKEHTKSGVSRFYFSEISHVLQLHDSAVSKQEIKNRIQAVIWNIPSFGIQSKGFWKGVPE